MEPSTLDKKIDSIDLYATHAIKQNFYTIFFVKSLLF